MNIPVRQAIGPDEARRLDTAGLRANFLVETLFVPGEITLVYTHHDRTVIGGAQPLAGELTLTSAKPIGSDTFLARREMGVFNIGGPGRVTADGTSYALAANDCLYLPAGTRDVRFASDAPHQPARFYLVSTPAHAPHPARLIRMDEARRLDLGGTADANRRVLRQYIHPEICTSCQLVMGMTALEEGSVWNTMPCHTHDRRSEVYLYFGMEEATRVFHMMGEPDETRHLVVANEQAIISPGWSIHCGAGTGRYAFIWSMAGDNQDFGDMDMVAMADLR